MYCMFCMYVQYVCMYYKFICMYCLYCIYTCTVFMNVCLYVRGLLGRHDGTRTASAQGPLISVNFRSGSEPYQINCFLQKPSAIAPVLQTQVVSVHCIRSELYLNKGKFLSGYSNLPAAVVSGSWCPFVCQHPRMDR